MEQPTVSYGTIDYIDVKNVSVTGGNSCALQKGTMIFTQGSYSMSYVLNNTGDFSYQFAASPYNGFGAGSISVIYKVLTTCGTTKDIGPGSFTVTIKSGLGNPQFQASWFDSAYYSGYNTPTTMIPIGETISLGPITKPAISANGDPGTPYDPNGDSIIYTWDFAGSSDPWIKNLGDTNTGYGFDPHNDHFQNIKADTKGTHTVQVTGIDTEGASSGPYNVSVDIVDPNPVPVITPPGTVIEGRTYTPGFSCASSYSPYATRTIANCDWHSTVQSIYPTEGNYNIKLDVTDSAGLTSLSPATYTLAVQPDPPPIPGLDYASKGVRGQPMTFTDISQTTLGDPMLEHVDTLLCDTNNDGSFADETPITVTPDGNGNFNFTPKTVGSCKIHIHLKKKPGYQRTADKDFFFNVVDLQPTVNASVKGQIPQPSNINVTKYTMSDFLNATNFNVDDYYSSSRTSGLIYDSTEGALGAPHRSNMLYKAPTSNSYSQNTTSQASIPAGLDTRAGEFTWYNTSYGGGWTLGSHVWVSYGYTFNIYDIRTNTTHTIQKNDSNYTEGVSVNAGKDMVWVREYPSLFGMCNGYCIGGNVTDYFYHLSDLSNGITTPYNTKSQAGYGWYYPCQYCTNMAPQNPPPTDWSEPSSGISKPVDSTIPFNIMDVNGGTRHTDNTFFKTNQRDKNGNFYAAMYDSGNGTYRLAKYSPSNTLLWQASTTNWGYGGTIDVKYITSDNNRVITQYGMFDNNTGTAISPVDSGGYRIPIYSANFYQDIMYASYTASYQGSNHTWYDHHNVLYNVKTDTIMMDLIDNSWSDQNHGYQTTRSGTLTSDGKLVLPVYDTVNWKSTFKVYDVLTGTLLYTLDAPYGGNDIETILYQDGKGALTSDDHNNPPYGTLFSSGVDTTNQGGNFSYGNITDKGTTFSDGTISLSMKYVVNTYSDYDGAGITFREKDNQNLYQAELSTKRITLYKVVNGVRTTIDSEANPLTIGSYTDLIVKASGDHIRVYVGGVPMIDVHDSAFTSGKMGLFANAPDVYLKNFYTIASPSSAVDVGNVAIVGKGIDYSTNYSDPENDPAIPSLAKWTFTNTAPQKFLDAGDGYSDPVGTNSYNNLTVQSPYAVLNKVGVYKVDFTEPDDPAPVGYRHPNTAFQSFESYADPSTNYVTVVRPPVAQFNVTVNGDGTFNWSNDTSYDPDRWLSPTNYSTENTGINYQTTKGVMQRKYMYISPSGQTGYSQMIKPQETGTYTLYEAVADEYGLWSDWAQQDIYVSVLPPDLYPPVVTLTSPNGTSSSPSYVSTLTPTITWTQTDQDVNTTFTQFEVLIKDASSNVFEDYTGAQSTQSTSAQWALDKSLAMGQKYQVQVQVWDDGGKPSGFSNTGWMITNRPPVAYMSNPWGTQASPTPINTLQPTFQWAQSDPDPGDGITAYEIQVWDQAGTTMLYDSGQVSEGFSTASSYSMTPSGNLNIQPHQPARVRVQVWDSHSTPSGFSPDAWMVLNRAPSGNISYVSPIYQHDNPTFTVTQSDPDNDAVSITVDASYNGGGYTNVAQWTNVPSGTTKTFNMGPLNVGTYTLRLTISDGYGGTFQQTYPVVVSALSISGSVTHTADWEAYRQVYNTKFPSNVHAVTDFWAGEAFVLNAAVTNTGTSSTKPQTVTATLLEQGDSQTLTTSDNVNFTGNMASTNYEFNLTDGQTCTFRFTVTWNNGLVQTVDVPVKIKGNIDDVLVIQNRE